VAVGRGVAGGVVVVGIEMFVDEVVVGIDIVDEFVVGIDIVDEVVGVVKVFKGTPEISGEVHYGLGLSTC